jgi:hypothetical protein
MRFAESHEGAEIRDEYRCCDMTINIVTHFARLPAAQAPTSLRNRLREFGISLPPQQRGCFKYRAVNRLFAIKLTNSRIEQRDYVLHPFAWRRRTYARDSLCLSNISIHNLLHPLPAAAAFEPTDTPLNTPIA